MLAHEVVINSDDAFPRAPVSGGHSGGPLSGARRLLPSWAMSNATAAAALAGTATVAFLTAWFLMSPAVEQADRRLLVSLIVGNGVIAAGFASLIGARLWHVWSNRRNQLAGSATHIKLVWLFSAVAVVPAIVAFLFAFTILRSSLNDVFGERIENYHNTARELANAYVDYKRAELQKSLEELSYDVAINEERGLGLEGTPVGFREYILAQAAFRGFDAVYVLSGGGQLLVRAELREAVYKLPAKEVMDTLAKGAPGAGVFGVSDDSKLDMFRIVYKLSQYENGYLIAYQSLDPKTIDRLISVRRMKADWEEAKVSRARSERIFLVGYIVLAVIILFAAIWAGLWAATRIVRPIGRLIEMAGRVSSGELGARVDVQKDDGELGVLARSMNHMTAQLQTQRDDLIDTNKQFDRRRRFTEAVLSGVSAGVIGVGPTRKITIANRSAGEMVDEESSRLIGRDFAGVLPEARDLFEQAAEPPYEEVASQISVERDGLARTLSVRIVSDEVDGGRSFVVTFDDITQLISAQRSAAWGDIARRIAHEIKNPLTPIQLSAERLRRKYLGEIKNSPDIFDKCTETIIRHVGDIGRMVDEFSSFARMPKPVIAAEDLNELARSAVFSQRVATPDVDIDITTPSEPLIVLCDGRLIVQALGNILKNAGESIAARIAGADEAAAAKGRIRLAVEYHDGAAVVSVMDNGVGLPKAERHRLTEPYMTTRAKGTGLGLAIVRKVVEEHGGSLFFDDCDALGPTGASVRMQLPSAGSVARPAAAE